MLDMVAHKATEPDGCAQPSAASTAPMRTLSALKHVWFVGCVVGAAVTPLIPAIVAPGAIAIGLVLLVAEEDRRYGQLAWQDSYRAFVSGHRWSPALVTVAMAVCASGFAMLPHARGVYLICLGAYAVLHLAAPVHERQSDAPVGP